MDVSTLCTSNHVCARAGSWSSVATRVHALHFKGGSVKPWQLLGRGYSIKTCNKLKNGVPIARWPAAAFMTSLSVEPKGELQWTPLNSRLNSSDEIEWDSDTRQCKLRWSDRADVRWAPPLPKWTPQQASALASLSINQSALAISSWVLDAASRIPRECCDLQTVLASLWYRIQRGGGSDWWG